MTLDLDAILEWCDRQFAPTETERRAIVKMRALVGRIQELEADPPSSYGLVRIRELEACLAQSDRRAVKAEAERDEARLELANELGPAELLSRFTRIEQAEAERDEADATAERKTLALADLKSERDTLLRGGFGKEPSGAGGPGHEEQFWQRHKLDAAILHLRDIEDFYRLRGGKPESFNMVRADRARAIYEQISDDYLNGSMTRPTLKQRLEAICGLTCELLGALQPWGFHSPEVRRAATRLTVAIAAVPVPEPAQEAGE